jgi:hypothetical protein
MSLNGTSPLIFFFIAQLGRCLNILGKICGVNYRSMIAIVYFFTSHEIEFGHLLSLRFYSSYKCVFFYGRMKDNSMSVCLRCILICKDGIEIILFS